MRVVSTAKYADEQGQERPCLMLPWRETMILVTGYSVPMRARVIDRWAELEAAEAARTALPTEPPQELFPPNALERLTGTAIENVKRWGKSIRDSVWQSAR